ncbi:HAMP domain-containing sensor histidine kinase [Candidatus Solincola tengchongensis]|uniref:sensor histidine kinase n=1 Tax=Candidatus Solincola tengchongensis TaxID=2900693 RepID=UPI003312FFF5
MEAFAQMVSHDLRAPLTSIEGFAALARAAAEGKLEPGEMEYFEYISRACRGMEDIISSILEMARSGLQPENWREVDLEELVLQVWEELGMKERAPSARLELELDRRTVNADPALLKQVMANLLDNAVKFNLRHPSPLVRVGSRKKGGETVVCVKDNGPGIPEEQLGRLFEPFQRMDDSSPGLGIGLSTVRRIVSRWKGRLEVESTPGEGSVFSFSVPD